MFFVMSIKVAAPNRADHTELHLLIYFFMTAFFLIVILGATGPKGIPSMAPIAIGLALTLIHLTSIPVTNTSVNPARSTGVAFFADGPALSQLWLFWVAPMIGAALGALVHKLLADREDNFPSASPI